jgi:mono/diheme cytochrome c family protein
MIRRFLVFVPLLFASLASAAEKPVDFARHVQPILAAKCVKCHGPGEASGGIAFDKQEHALAEADSGEKAIVPGKAAESELIKRVTSDDESVRMPPEGKPLTPAEIAIITKWIDQGAEWSKHWAYRPLKRPQVPEVKHKDWAKSEIDAFILEGLEDAGLDPSPRAEKIALVRRAYFNLIGLPPTPEEVTAFVNDNSPDAWEKLIDKLLASEHYGEHWGRKWLDVVRYADTNSFERDGVKPHAWRYRDYVIRSFNDDKPYDEFLKQQLAGDERPNRTADDLIATGFYRLGVWDDEPADRELAMYEGFDDLVTTIGQGMLGLTFNCARCHDHKLDPIPSADYYKLVAFVRNLAPMQTTGPNIEEAIFPTPESRQQYEAAMKSHTEKVNAIQAEITQLEKKFVAAYDADRVSVRDIDDLQYRFYRDTWNMLPDFDNLKAEDQGKIESGLFDISLATREFSFGFVYNGTLKVPADGDYTFFLDSDDGSRLTVDGRMLIEYDGIHGEGDEKSITVPLKQGRVQIRVDYFQGPVGAKGLSVAWKGPNFKRRSLSVDKKRRPKELDVARLFKANGKEFVGEGPTNRYLQLQKEMEELKRGVPVEKALVVKELGPNAADVYVLLRGTPGNHGDKVEPGFPEIFGGQPAQVSPLPADAKSTGRRTALANWIASPENLLTARVMVNRVWQGHFGRGIVRSPNNFGSLGVPPTHPELLDYLASDFVAGGWKLKRLHKTIMMSAAYQQSSKGNAAGLAKDPANDLFWRYDMRRLSAEEIRDSIHVVNGSFNPKMYGPGTYPEIQREVLEGQSVPGSGWGKSSPEEQARRSVYVHVKRSLITPLLASFDFPETDTTCEARFTTTQPGQSFALLNSKYANDQAQVFADRLKREAGNDLAAQVKLAYRLTTNREATETEVARAREFVGKLETKYGLSHDKALQQFSLFMLNLNEFVYLD